MQKLCGDRDGNGRRLLARNAGDADGAGQPCQRRLSKSRIAEPFEESRALGLGADQPSETEPVIGKQRAADVVVHGVGIGQHKMERAIRRCCGSFGRVARR